MSTTERITSTTAANGSYGSTSIIRVENPATGEKVGEIHNPRAQVVANWCRAFALILGNETARRSKGVANQRPCRSLVGREQPGNIFKYETSRSEGI